MKLTVRDPQTPSSVDTPPAAPSPYWGDEAIWNSQTTVHSFAMDKQARVWAAARVRKPADAGMVPGGIGSSVGEVVPDHSTASAGWSSTIRKPRRRPPSTPASRGAT